jgi:hypothetical protein
VRFDIIFYSYVHATPGPSDLWSGNIHNAVALFFFNSTAAQGTYGPIASLDVSFVTSMFQRKCPLLSHVLSPCIDPRGIASSV